MRYLIVSGGMATDAFVSETVKNGGYDVVMAVDSGMEFLHRIGVTPDIIVGDLDSASSETLDYFRQKEQIDMCILNPEKDDTDTEFAIREAIRRGAKEISIIAGTGTRLDHVLGNVALLGIGLEENVQICLMDEHNRIRMVDKPVTLQKAEQYGNYISLLPWSEEVTGVTLTGFKYLLSDYTMKKCSSLGISNEILDEEAEVCLRSGYLLVIEARD